MARCREATVADPKAKRYVDILLSSVEYDTFVKLMKIMRPVAAAKLASNAADEKSGSGSDAKGSSSHNQHHSPSKLSKDVDDYGDSRADSKFDDVAEAKTDKGEK